MPDTDPSDGAEAPEQAAPISGVMSFGGVAIRATASSDELMAMARKCAMDPTVFEEHAPFFGRASISTNKIDAYFTRMRPSSLKNYADEAQTGVSVLTGHNHYSLGVGYSLTGSYTGGANSRVESDFYSIQGLPDTDDAITRIRAGLVRDTSIGFYGGDIVCSICGRSWMDWDCMHIPGFSYALDPKDANSEKVTAIGDVENAHLAEYSLVFDGATPGAGLLKVYREIDSGRVTPEMARSIEHRFRLRLPASVTSHRFAGWTETPGGVTVPADRATAPEPPAERAPEPEPTTAPTPPTQERVMPDTEEERAKKAAAAEDDPEKKKTEDDPEDAADGGADEGDENPDGSKKKKGDNATCPGLEDDEDKKKSTPVEGENAQVVAIRAVLVSVGQPADRDPIEGIRALHTEIERLRPLADDGRRYRADLITDAIEEGTRAFGNGFAIERYTALFERDSTSVDDIKGMRDDWRAIADAAIPTGRAIKDKPEPPTEPERKQSVPDAAFAA
jgi:hypothetical protein